MKRKSKAQKEKEALQLLENLGYKMKAPPAAKPEGVFLLRFKKPHPIVPGKMVETFLVRSMVHGGMRRPPTGTEFAKINTKDLQWRPLSRNKAK